MAAVRCILMLMLAVSLAQGSRRGPRQSTRDCRMSWRWGEWREGCNWCSCWWGRKYCTAKSCTPADLRYSSCLPECFGYAAWRRDCNWCRCRRGRAICTNKDCGNGGPSCTDEQRKQCPEFRQLDYMIVKGCKPVYKPGRCCAAYFQCPDVFDDGSSRGQCYFRGKFFNDGDGINAYYACFVGCICSQGRIICALPGCAPPPPTTPGCWNRRTLNSCCPGAEVCKTATTPTCTYNSKTYYDGQLMSFSDVNNAAVTCQECACTSAYTNPFGPNCRKTDCGYDLNESNKEKILKGCVPVFSKKSCCPVKYLCPGDEEVPDNQGSPNAQGRVCTFGKIKILRGQELIVDDPNINCKCNTAPDVLCFTSQ